MLTSLSPLLSDLMYPELEWICGPVHTGKTTKLTQRVALAPEQYCGLLAPVDEEGSRYLHDVVSSEQRRLTCSSEAADAIPVGPYHFHEEVFAWGRSLLRTHAEQYPKRTLIIDELGKLELRDAGLAPACWQVLRKRKEAGKKSLIVVRDSLVAAVEERLSSK